VFDSVADDLVALAALAGPALGHGSRTAVT
jgi:hypothetical protein